MTKMHIWIRGILAAVGIDPQHFNLQAGIGSTMRIGLAAAIINAVIGVAAYLQRIKMPVVGSSAYSTAGQVTSLVRSLLNDSQGNLFTDTVLLPYANQCQQFRLRGRHAYAFR